MNHSRIQQFLLSQCHRGGRCSRALLIGGTAASLVTTAGVGRLLFLLLSLGFTHGIFVLLVLCFQSAFCVAGSSSSRQYVGYSLWLLGLYCPFHSRSLVSGLVLYGPSYGSTSLDRGCGGSSLAGSSFTHDRSISGYRIWMWLS